MKNDNEVNKNAAVWFLTLSFLYFYFLSLFIRLSISFEPLSHGDTFPWKLIV